jgi:hypothetical protein
MSQHVNGSPHQFFSSGYRKTFCPNGKRCRRELKPIKENQSKLVKNPKAKSNWPHACRSQVRLQSSITF